MELGGPSLDGACLLCVSIWVAVAVLTPTRLELAAIRRKLGLLAYGVAYLGLSRDSRFQLPPDPGKSSTSSVAKRRIVFVRHGESAWNECFNRSFDALFLPRVLLALLRELAMLLCADSLFLDSPLSSEGLVQARLLESFVESEQGEDLRRICEAAVFVSSCLRRAAATGFLAFGRFLSVGRPVWYLSCLQEISHNIDTLALAPPFCAPVLRPCENADVATAGSSARTVHHAAFNIGNKGLGSHGAHRLEAFCEWVFSPCSPAALQPNVVVAGHSLWFRTFFQVYLPHATYHECKQAKITNCGVIMFDLECLQSEGGRFEYRISPESVVTVYGGFEQKKQRYWTRSCKKD